MSQPAYFRPGFGSTRVRLLEPVGEVFGSTTVAGESSVEYLYDVVIRGRESEGAVVLGVPLALHDKIQEGITNSVVEEAQPGWLHAIRMWSRQVFWYAFPPIGLAPVWDFMRGRDFLVIKDPGRGDVFSFDRSHFVGEKTPLIPSSREDVDKIVLHIFKTRHRMKDASDDSNNEVKTEPGVVKSQPVTDAHGTKRWYRDGKLHRDDGPASEWANGSKYWYRDGKLHRDDGPASEWANGSKYWYRDGELHRDDGPAVEEASGYKAWYLDGKCHRDDAPACECRNGSKSWYRDGLLHREDGPAVEFADGYKAWCRDGKYHREDGPAVEHADGTKEWYLNGEKKTEAEVMKSQPAIDAHGTKRWYHDGKLHREDGPAIEWANGDKWWYRDGKYHRDDGPAVEFANGSKYWYLNGEKKTESEVMKSRPVIDSYGTKSWYRDGNLHREDGPAIEYVNGAKYWYREGNFHREDGPAIEYVNGAKYWYREGNFHREDGPAIEYANGDKVWYRDGNFHREDGPAIEYANGDKVWYRDGNFHREDGPAVEWASGYKAWYLDGKCHREDGPAIEFTNGDKYWYRDGNLHREDGPAVERADGTKHWYLNGELKTEAEVMKSRQPVTDADENKITTAQETVVEEPSIQPGEDQRHPQPGEVWRVVVNRVGASDPNNKSRKLIAGDVITVDSVPGRFFLKGEKEKVFHIRYKTQTGWNWIPVVDCVPALAPTICDGVQGTNSDKIVASHPTYWTIIAQDGSYSVYKQGVFVDKFSRYTPHLLNHGALSDVVELRLSVTTRHYRLESDHESKTVFASIKRLSDSELWSQANAWFVMQSEPLPERKEST